MLAFGRLTTFPMIALAQSPIVAQKDVDRAGDGERTKPTEQPGSTRTGKRYEQALVRPSEGYFAGFAGYTFGGKFDADGIGILNGVTNP